MFSTQCASCDRAVGQGPECAICKFKFHYKCGGITERGFSKLGSGRSTWLCPGCKKESLPLMSIDTDEGASSPGISLESTKIPSPTPAPPKPQVSEKEHHLAAVNPPHLSVLNDILQKISALQSEMTAMITIQKDIQQLKNDLADVKTNLNAKLEDMSKKIVNIEERVVSLEGSKEDIERLRLQVNEMLENGHRNEQWGRRSNIQINGIPSKAGENLMDIIKKLADRSNFPLNPDNDIDFVTRIAVKNNTESNLSKPIIVKLQSRYKKDELLSALRKLKNLKANDIGFTGSNNRIYFNDHLSARNKQLLQQAKKIAREKNYVYCWVRNCTIMVRRSDTSPVIHITSHESLKKII